MKSYTTLTRSPLTEKYLDNTGSYFNVSRLFLTDNSGVVVNGHVVLDNGSVTETKRVLEINSNNQLITELFSGAFVNGDLCSFRTYDGVTPGVQELVSGSSQLYIMPCLSTQNETKTDREDIKELEASRTPMASTASYYSSPWLIEKSSTVSLVQITGSATNPIIFSRPQYSFYDENLVTLDVSGVGSDQFVDIYIEDSGATPYITGTKRIALAGKASGTSAYTTSASAGQFLIGSVYIKSTKIIGIDTLRDKSNSLYSLVNNASYSLNITSTTDYDLGTSMYIPIFHRGVLDWKLMASNTTGTNAATDWSFNLGMAINGVLVDYDETRKSPMPTNTKAGRIPGLVQGLYQVDTSQLLELQIAGKLCDLYTYSNAVTVDILRGNFEFSPDVHFQPDVIEVPWTPVPNFVASKSDFGSAAIYDVKEYKGKIYVPEETAPGGNYTLKVFEYDPVTDTWSESTSQIDNSSILHYYRMCIHDNKLYLGAYDSLNNNKPKTRFDGSTWDRGLSLTNVVKRDIISYNGKVYYAYASTPARIYYSTSGDQGTFTSYKAAPAGPTDFYTMCVWQNKLWMGTDTGKVYCFDGTDITEKATIKAGALYTRGLTVLDEYLIASADEVVKVTTDGENWETIPSPVGSPALTRIDKLITIGPMVFACGGSNNVGGAKLFYTDRNFSGWNELVVDGSVQHGYFGAMHYYDNYLYLITRNKSATTLKNVCYKGTLS